MTKSFNVDVVPQVLSWLRTSAGWEIEEVAKKLGTSVEIFKDLELGKSNPTLRQLHTLSEIYKRPIASFFLSKPKEENPMPKDYRLLPNKTNVFDRKTILAIRRTRSLQNLSKELSLNINYATKTEIKSAKLTDNPVTGFSTFVPFGAYLASTDSNSCLEMSRFNIFRYSEAVSSGLSVSFALLISVLVA